MISLHPDVTFPRYLQEDENDLAIGLVVKYRTIRKFVGGMIDISVIDPQNRVNNRNRDLAFFPVSFCQKLNNCTLEVFLSCFVIT